MTSASETLDDQQKELCAVLVMRVMLEGYSADAGISFEEALFRFTCSTTYETLFDFSTGLWREGPVYIREYFEEALKKSEP